MHGKYAQDNVSFHPSRIAIRKKGSMDTELWHDLYRSVYAKCYDGKLSPEPIRDPVTRKLIKGPLIVKTDAGPGRLSNAAKSIDFCEEMRNLGVFIVLSLPNGTEAQAELDQMYSLFKPKCKASALRVVGRKMAARLHVRQAFDDKHKNQSSDEDDSDNSVSSILECTPANKRKKKGNSIGNVSLSKRDLANIVNGFPDNAVENRPFDFCFTRENIIKCWIAVGFMPMTGNAANDPRRTGMQLSEYYYRDLMSKGN